FRQKRPADCRVHAEDGEVIAGDGLRLNDVSVDRNPNRPACADDTSTRLTVAAVVQVFGEREGILDIAASGAVEPSLEADHASCILDRQLLQRDRIEQREDRRVDADPKRERENRDTGESRAAAEHTDGVTNVLDEPVEKRQALLSALPLARLGPS